MRSIKLRFELGSDGYGAMERSVKRGDKYGIKGVYYDVTGAERIKGTNLIEFSLTNGEQAKDRLINNKY